MPSMTACRHPLGIIEAFFGRPWSWGDRHATIDFLADLNWQFYIYAPKDDRFLRQGWRTPWPAERIGHIVSLRRKCRERGIAFGIGLSPFELHGEEISGPHRQDLNRKVDELNTIEPDILCLLFDDMRGDTPDLAGRQLQIVDAVGHAMTADQLIVCPTYYSFDTRLDDVFGARPERYLEALGSGLASGVEIFWTGPAVCSRAYPSDHLHHVAAALRRKPFLWDNYPVNDSARLAPHIQLGPFLDRPVRLRDETAGHAINPMNQAWLSRIPLLCLQESYRQGGDFTPDHAFRQACVTACGGEVGSLIADDYHLFQKTGLDRLTGDQKTALSTRYRRYDESPYAREIMRWLAGDYAFDPACLT